MKKRVISGAIFSTLLIIIMVVDIPLVDTLLVFTLSVLGIYEYNKAFKSAGFKPVSWVGYIGCFAIFGMGELIDDASQIMLIKIFVPTLIIALFMYMIVTNLKRTIIDVAITVFSLLYIPFMFSFIKLILAMENSRVLIWYVFLGAFASDTFAYLIGSKFGKTKLCPDISPNKTVEGSMGGILGVVISYCILNFIANKFFFVGFDYAIVVIAGIVAGIAGQFGDLSASAIKRYCKIKDFGNIIPGHGGILDRFDSVLFVAPIVYIFLKVYIFM